MKLIVRGAKAASKQSVTETYLIDDDNDEGGTCLALTVKKILCEKGGVKRGRGERNFWSRINN
jgi:hypothetical protein